MGQNVFVLGLPGSGKLTVRYNKHSQNRKDEIIVIVIEFRDTTTSDQSPSSLVTDLPLGKIFRSWIPTNEKNAFFTLIAMIYLVFAAIHFCITGDGSMLTYLLVAVAGYAGVKGIEGKINQKKDKGDH